MLLPITRNMLFRLKNKTALDFSLLGGDFGCVMYLYYAAQNELCDINEIHPLLDKVLSNTYIDAKHLTYCNGIAGLCAGLIQLEKDGIIDGALDSVSVYKNYIKEAVKNYIKSDLDFLHGAVGMALPLLYLAKTDDEIYDFVRETVNLLFVHSIKGKANDIFWLYRDRKGECRENLSLSHGIASTSQYLARCISILEDCSERDIAFNLLEGIGNYFNRHLLDPKACGCYTPMIPSSNFSRLAWCYGDIGTSVALRGIGELLNNSIYKELSFDIASFAARNRREINKNCVKDACLCHGASGIMAFFNNCSKYYQDNYVFKEASLYWQDVTLSMTDIYEGYREFGYYTYNSSERQQMDPMLEGNAGVGMALLNCQSFIDNIFLFNHEV